MSQRDSGYARIPRDAYQTPPHVTLALMNYLPAYAHNIWEPAAGEGKMADALRTRYGVIETDISDGIDFLDAGIVRGIDWRPEHGSGIVTNPPYSHAREFIVRALSLTRPIHGFVAMLLPLAYDSAKTRKHLFEYPHAKKIILTRRIVWKEREDGKKAAPSENHCWHIWDWQHQGPIQLYYH